MSPEEFTEEDYQKLNLIEKVDETKELSFFDDFVQFGLTLGFDQKYLNLLGLGLLAGACKDKIYTTTEWGPIYTNIFGIFIGESAIYQKTPTLNYSKSIVPKNTFLPNSGTFEGLIKYIQDTNRKSGLIVVDELSTWISNSKKEYNQGIKSQFMELFDCSDIEKVLAKDDGNINIKNPVISFIAGIQPETFARIISEDDYTSGFIPRFLVAYPKNPLPFKYLGSGLKISEDIERLKQKYQKLLNIVALFEKEKLHLEFDEKTIIYINELRNKYYNECLKNPHEAKVWSKAMFYIYKILMLLSIDNTLINNTNNTLDILYKVEQILNSFIADSLAIYCSIKPNVLSIISQSILADIEKYGKIDKTISDNKSIISHSELYSRTFAKHSIHAKKFTMIMGNLMEMNKVMHKKVKGKTKPTIYYTLA